MDGLEKVVAAPVHTSRLLLGIGAPEQEDNALAVLRDPTDDGVCQSLPAVVLK